jgi:hypothetical protein
MSPLPCDYDSKSQGVRLDSTVGSQLKVRTIVGRGSPSSLLPITLDPSLVNEFKRLLLSYQRAVISTYYSDGKTGHRTWDASKFLESSNVMCNFRSGPEFRQGAWQEAGIAKVDVCVVRNSST